MPAPKELIDLVERFGRHVGEYRAGRYNETQVRREYIDPLFKILGWDVANEQGHAPAYQEVIHEDAVKIGGLTKAPDYSFRVGGVRKFFLEAKKPSVAIEDDPGPAFQLRRYAWSAGLPLSVLTDFEEFAVYDCRVRPKKTDKPSTARTVYLTYKEYADRWDEIASVFARKAVLQGSFDRYAETGKKRGTEAVDDAFLEEIEDWREALAKNIALRNRRLSQRELNFAIQRTIDRIVFLRICEDRGAEEYGRLLALTNGPHVYDRLKERFERADERYNSGLFHFRDEKDRAEPPDALTPRVKIDDDVLAKILKGLYYPESPYEFSVLPAEILGAVYERFLGKVIRLTAGHHAKVEEKPEVKKAGGVYYTPHYIVEYIVKETLGQLLEGKTPKQAAKIRVLDPACGSGSFLLGAYRHLLIWYRDRYIEDGPEKHPKELVEIRGAWHLTTAEKKRILLQHIHGVDIDPQAVEVTKLSLLLKVLEGETDQTLRQTVLFHERALPDLASNIKCGNSLIGPDFFRGEQTSLFDDETRLRVNAFDWEAEFPAIMKAGGFDAVIGNPPYIRIQTLTECAPEEVEHYKRAYRSAAKGNYDIYVVFVEQGLRLLGKAGRLGFILPHKFFNAKYGEPLRGLVSEGKHLAKVVHFGDAQVFEGATTYTTLLFLEKVGRPSFEFVRVTDLDSWCSSGTAESGEVRAEIATAAEWNFAVGEGAALVDRLLRDGTQLGQVADIYVGVQTSADDVFIMDFVSENSGGLTLRSKALGREWTFEKNLLRPIISGTDVKRYGVLSRRQFVLFPYRIVDGRAVVVDMKIIEKQFPKTAKYFHDNQDRLKEREGGKLRRGAWHGYIYLKNMARQSTEKVCVPRLVERLCASYDEGGSFCLDNVDVGGLSWKEEHRGQSMLYLLALLNSRLLGWVFPFVSAPFRGGWRSANRQFLSQLPIRLIELTNPAQLAQRDRLNQLAGTLLSLHRRTAAARTDHERTALDRQIAATDREIDRIVYELYGLSADEIALVDKGSSS